jgi:alkylation response protein AidB-like acyl-CoA dehydrogenase
VLGLLIPAQYGGAGAGIAEMSQVLDTQAQNCASTAMVTLMHFYDEEGIPRPGDSRSPACRIV